MQYGTGTGTGTHWNSHNLNVPFFVRTVSTVCTVHTVRMYVLFDSKLYHSKLIKNFSTTHTLP